MNISDKLILSCPIRISSDSRKEAVAKLQQVPVLSWLLTSVQLIFFSVLKLYCADRIGAPKHIMRQQIVSDLYIDDMVIVNILNAN